MLVILRDDIFLTWSRDRNLRQMIHYKNHDYSGNQKRSHDMSLVSVKWTEYNL